MGHCNSSCKNVTFQRFALSQDNQRLISIPTASQESQSAYRRPSSASAHSQLHGLSSSHFLWPYRTLITDSVCSFGPVGRQSSKVDRQVLGGEGKREERNVRHIVNFQNVVRAESLVSSFLLCLPHVQTTPDDPLVSNPQW